MLCSREERLKNRKEKCKRKSPRYESRNMRKTKVTMYHSPIWNFCCSLAHLAVSLVD